jgi:serine/threonine-protein kinase
VTLLLGRYELGELLGQGGMGEVRLARDHKLARMVAVKLLRPELAGQASVRRRFEAEARAAARVVHPNVVVVLDTGEHDGVPFIVMEQMSGRTLRHVIERGPMSAERVRSVALQVLAALNAAHRAGLVHRDIKPGNILEGESGQWKVADFGIAKSLELADGDLTSVGLVLGTPAYLAPERLGGTPATVASDLYAVGVVLYECLAGRPPFEADNPLALATLVSTQRPEPVRARRSDVPASLAATVDRAMALDPADRFETAAGMALAIEPNATTALGVSNPTIAVDPTIALDATRPSRVRLPVPPPDRADATVALRSPAGNSPAAYRSRRRLGVWAAAIAAGVVALSLLVALTKVPGRASTAGPGTTSPPTTATLTATSALPAGLDGALRQLEREVQP